MDKAIKLILLFSSAKAYCDGGCYDVNNQNHQHESQTTREIHNLRNHYHSKGSYGALFICMIIFCVVVCIGAFFCCRKIAVDQAAGDTDNAFVR